MTQSAPFTHTIFTLGSNIETQGPNIRCRVFDTSEGSKQAYQTAYELALGRATIQVRYAKEPDLAEAVKAAADAKTSQRGLYILNQAFAKETLPQYYVLKEPG